MAKTRRNLENMDSRCYVVYGSGFNPMKIKGNTEKVKLIAYIKKMGFTPKYVVVNIRQNQRCTRKATLFNKIDGYITIKLKHGDL
jgi:hypothetical protein